MLKWIRLKIWKNEVARPNRGKTTVAFTTLKEASSQSPVTDRKSSGVRRFAPSSARYRRFTVPGHPVNAPPHAAAAAGGLASLSLQPSSIHPPCLPSFSIFIVFFTDHASRREAGPWILHSMAGFGGGWGGCGDGGRKKKKKSNGKGRWVRGRLFRRGGGGQYSRRKVELLTEERGLLQGSASGGCTVRISDGGSGIHAIHAIPT